MKANQRPLEHSGLISLHSMECVGIVPAFLTGLLRIPRPALRALAAGDTNIELSESRDLCSRQYLQHHSRSVFVLAVNDDDSLEARLLEVHSDFLARALDDGIVRRVHPVEIVVEKDDSKLLRHQSFLSHPQPS